MRIVCVEGIIGVGKTTYIRNLADTLRRSGLSVVVISENVKLWRDRGYLAAFYKEPARRAYSFQTMTFVTRAVAYREAIRQPADVYICERSFFSDRHIFGAMLRDDMEGAAHVYDQWYDFAEQQRVVPADTVTIYLRADVATCQRRVRARARSEESLVGDEYQQRLADLHDQHFMNRADVEVVDATPRLGAAAYEKTIHVGRCVVQRVRMC
jgi:deoxyadenosine/deoxycytidine kinase